MMNPTIADLRNAELFRVNYEDKYLTVYFDKETDITGLILKEVINKDCAQYTESFDQHLYLIQIDKVVDGEFKPGSYLVLEEWEQGDRRKVTTGDQFLHFESALRDFKKRII